MSDSSSEESSVRSETSERDMTRREPGTESKKMGDRWRREDRWRGECDSMKGNKRERGPSVAFAEVYIFGRCRLPDVKVKNFIMEEKVDWTQNKKPTEGHCPEMHSPRPWELCHKLTAASHDSGNFTYSVLRYRPLGRRRRPTQTRSPTRRLSAQLVLQGSILLANV
jgi:hypothetical protein